MKALWIILLILGLIPTIKIDVYTTITKGQPKPAGAKKGHSPRFEPPGELLLASVLVLGPGRHVPALHWHRLVGVDVVLRPDGSTAADLQHSLYQHSFKFLAFNLTFPYETFLEDNLEVGLILPPSAPPPAF